MKKAKSKLNNILGQGDLQAIGDLMGGLMDKQSAVFRKDIEVLRAEMATKDDLKNLERDLKAYMRRGFESVMQGMDNVSDRFVEKEKFERLVQWAQIVGAKVGVKPKI